MNQLRLTGHKRAHIEPENLNNNDPIKKSSNKRIRTENLNLKDIFSKFFNFTVSQKVLLARCFSVIFSNFVTPKLDKKNEVVETVDLFLAPHKNQIKNIMCKIFNINAKEFKLLYEFILSKENLIDLFDNEKTGCVFKDLFLESKIDTENLLSTKLFCVKIEYLFDFNLDSKDKLNFSELDICGLRVNLSLINLNDLNNIQFDKNTKIVIHQEDYFEYSTNLIDSELGINFIALIKGLGFNVNYSNEFGELNLRLFILNNILNKISFHNINQVYFLHDLFFSESLIRKFFLCVNENLFKHQFFRNELWKNICKLNNYVSRIIDVKRENIGIDFKSLSELYKNKYIDSYFKLQFLYSSLNIIVDRNVILKLIPQSIFNKFEFNNLKLYFESNFKTDFLFYYSNDFKNIYFFSLDFFERNWNYFNKLVEGDYNYYSNSNSNYIIGFENSEFGLKQIDTENLLEVIQLQYEISKKLILFIYNSSLYKESRINLVLRFFSVLRSFNFENDENNEVWNEFKKVCKFVFYLEEFELDRIIDIFRNKKHLTPIFGLKCLEDFLKTKMFAINESIFLDNKEICTHPKFFFEELIISNIVFRHLNLSSYSFFNSTLSNVTFVQCNLSESNFKNCKIGDFNNQVENYLVKFLHCNLEKAEFIECKLFYVLFNENGMNNVNFNKSEFCDVQFEKNDLKESVFSETKFHRFLELEDDEKYENEDGIKVNYIQTITIFLNNKLEFSNFKYAHACFAVFKNCNLENIICNMGTRFEFTIFENSTFSENVSFSLSFAKSKEVQNVYIEKNNEYFDELNSLNQLDEVFKIEQFYNHIGERSWSALSVISSIEKSNIRVKLITEILNEFYDFKGKNRKLILLYNASILGIIIDEIYINAVINEDGIIGENHNPYGSLQKYFYENYFRDLSIHGNSENIYLNLDKYKLIMFLINSYELKNINKFLLEFNGFVNQIIFFENNNEVTKSILSMQNLYFDNLSHKIVPVAQQVNLALDYDNDENSLPEQNLIFMSANFKFCMVVDFKYYRKFFLKENIIDSNIPIEWVGNSQHVMCFKDINRSVAFDLRPLMLDYFSEITLFKEPYEKEMSTRKIFDFIGVLELGKFTNKFKHALSTNKIEELNQKIIDINEQIELSEFFEVLYSAPEDKMDAQLSVYAMNLITDMFDLNSKTILRKILQLLALAGVFLRLSSNDFLGIEHDSPFPLRVFIVALFNKAHALNRENNCELLKKESVMLWKKKCLGVDKAFSCTAILFSEIKSFFDEMHYADCTIFYNTLPNTWKS